MKTILLALLGFVLSGIFLLPFINAELVLPESYYLYAPIALMFIAILIQIDGAFVYRRILKARKLAVENDAFEVEIKDLTSKLHQEKKQVTDLRTQLAGQDREVRQLSSQLEQLQRSLSTAAVEKQELKTAFGDALSKQKASEQQLQDLSQKMQSGEKDVVHLLSLLQEKGRFVDFLKDDITLYPDAQIGAAARVVHQGCAKVIDDYFEIAPLSQEEEGTTISVGENFHPHEYRLLGKVVAPPFRGTVLHRGWCAKKVKLPQLVAREKDLPGGAQVITPAEIELS